MFEQLVAIKQHLELRAPLREALEHVSRRRRLAVFAAKTNLLVNKLDGRFRLGADLGMAFQKLFSKRPLTPAPAFNHLLR